VARNSSSSSNGTSLVWGVGAVATWQRGNSALCNFWPFPLPPFTVQLLLHTKVAPTLHCASPQSWWHGSYRSTEEH